MKQIISVLMTIVLIALLFVGCGESGADTQTTESTTTTTESVEEEATTTTTDEVTTTAKPTTTKKVTTTKKTTTTTKKVTMTTKKVTTTAKPTTTTKKVTTTKPTTTTKKVTTTVKPTTTTAKPTTTTQKPTVTAKPTTTTVSYIYITSMYPEDYEVEVTKGETVTIELEVKPFEATEPIVWSSSNNAIATVDKNGVVKGIATGQATIYARSLVSGESTSVDVTVREYTPLTDIEFEEYSATVYLGTPYTVECTASPTSATEPITWTSSDESIATVDQNGVITGVAEGKATIRAEGFYGDEYDTINITVKEDILGKCSLTTPALPATVSYYNYDNSIRDTFSITGLTYEFKEYYVEGAVTLTLYFTGEKTYDKDGPGQGRECFISWRLLDADGYVITSGTHYTDTLREGEKVKDSTETINKIAPGEYTLEVSNTN